jgi:hypothetical protein
MDIRMNDDTIPKETINKELKRQHVKKTSHGRKIQDRRQAWLPGSPHKSVNNKAGSYTFIILM